MQNILDFGAVGDGKTINTQAIQAAIDAGGVVFVPKGVFVTGTLYLKSNGGLYLDHGAVLKASHNREDYNAVDFCPQNRAYLGEFMVGTHLIVAVEQENVSIDGFGVIDGDSHFWVNEHKKEWYCDFYAAPSLEANRPGQMLFFCECKNVNVQNIYLRHSPFWHLFLHGCQDVHVHGLTIQGERKQWVNDGIDIDCCKRVTISDCIIDTGDDGITLRACHDPLRYSDGVCEDVVVSNCIITSYLGYGVRMGVGKGLIRNCLFSNIVIKDTLSAIGATCRFLPNADKGTCIENIRFQNLSIRAHSAFEIRLSNLSEQPPFKKETYIKNLSFNGVSAYCDRASCVLGHKGGNVSGVYFNNMQMYFKDEDMQNDRYNCNWIVKGIQSAFLVRQAKEVRFENTEFFYQETRFFKQGLCIENDD